MMGLFERYPGLWVTQVIVAIVVGVPVMPSLVHISNRTRHLFSTSA